MGLVRVNQEWWSTALKTGLMATRQEDLRHGTTGAYVARCLCRRVESTSGCRWLRTAVRVGQPKLGPMRSGVTDEHGDGENLRYFDLVEFIPAEWHKQHVRVSSYRAYRLKADLGGTEPSNWWGVRGQLFLGCRPTGQEWTEPLTGGWRGYTEMGDMRCSTILRAWGQCANTSSKTVR
jgi:hypothetical protein